ncbi:MAG: hypothetical protein ACFFFB_25620 [Candidatus Heimdallarchaeota archaeon]
MRKKENLLVLGMFSLTIAFILLMAGGSNPIANLMILLFLGLAIYSNARYVILTSLDDKKK